MCTKVIKHGLLQGPLSVLNLVSREEISLYIKVSRYVQCGEPNISGLTPCPNARGQLITPLGLGTTHMLNVRHRGGIIRTNTDMFVQDQRTKGF